MNPARERGMRAEREACVLLSQALDLDVRRMANQGIREDIGDLVGIPNVTVQVSAVPDNPTEIARRAKTKVVDAITQAERAGTTHSLVLLRIDGGHWRAICTTEQLDRHGALGDAAVLIDPPAPGHVIRWAPVFAAADWIAVDRSGPWVSTLNGWARTYLTQRTVTNGATR